MKKISKILFGLVFIVSSIFSFGGCEKTGIIPNGRYEQVFYTYESQAYVYVETKNNDYYWKIEGNKACFYGSGYLSEKAKIVEKGNSIYFECYEFTSIVDIACAIFSWEVPQKRGSNCIYVVQ